MTYNFNQLGPLLNWRGQKEQYYTSHLKDEHYFDSRNLLCRIEEVHGKMFRMSWCADDWKATQKVEAEIQYFEQPYG